MSKLVHKNYIQRLYRRSLKLAGDWYWQHEDYRAIALGIRDQFERHRFEVNPKKIERLILQTESMLAGYYHPQPYIRPTAPGGTKWERNLPMPEELVNRGMTPLDNSS